MGKNENELVARKFNSHPTPSYGKHSLESVENVALKILAAFLNESLNRSIRCSDDMSS
jgi:hypothetical protein